MDFGRGLKFACAMEEAIQGVTTYSWGHEHYSFTALACRDIPSGFCSNLSPQRHNLCHVGWRR